MSNMVLFREKLEEIVTDPAQVERICLLLERLEQIERLERRLRQQEGIQKAREEGRKLGRPRIEEPDNFSAIVAAWRKKRISALDAAQMCGIGLSTFYRRVKDLRNREQISLENQVKA